MRICDIHIENDGHTDPKRNAAMGAVIGALGALLSYVLSICIIRSLGMVYALLSPLLGVDRHSAAIVAAALGQLKNASVAPPILPALMMGLFMGMIAGGLFMKTDRRRIWMTIAIALLLLPFCLLCAEVNSIQFFTAVKIIMDLVRGNGM